MKNNENDNSDLPKAEEIEFTPEEMEFIHAECAASETNQAFSVSKAAVGAAVVGGVVGSVVFGGIGAVLLAGGAVYATTKSSKMERTGENVYSGLSKAGKAAKKGMKAMEAKYNSTVHRR